jgi:hypothetical protein
MKILRETGLKRLDKSLKFGAGRWKIHERALDSDEQKETV